jgi:hypothetical protein
MLITLVVLLLTTSPIAIIGVLLEVAAWRERRWHTAIARQIALTDALAAELGAVVAPVVTPAAWGPWRVRIAVPFARPLLVGRIVAITDQVLARVPQRHELVLVPQEQPAQPARRLPLRTAPQAA